MTSERKAQVKKHTINGAKLITAITALTAAVNGYLKLEEQNELVLQALGSKLNQLSVKVAYLEGVIAANHVAAEAHAAAESHVAPASEAMAAPPEAVVEEGEGADEADEALADEAASAEEDEAVAATAAPKKPEPVKAKRPMIQIQAYEEVPLKVGQLKQMQEQLQVQEEK